MLHFSYSIYDAHLREHFEFGSVFSFEKNRAVVCILYYMYDVVVNAKCHVRVSHLLMSLL